MGLLDRTAGLPSSHPSWAPAPGIPPPAVADRPAVDSTTVKPPLPGPPAAYVDRIAPEHCTDGRIWKQYTVWYNTLDGKWFWEQTGAAWLHAPEHSMGGRIWHQYTDPETYFKWWYYTDDNWFYEITGGPWPPAMPTSSDDRPPTSLCTYRAHRGSLLDALARDGRGSGGDVLKGMRDDA